MEIQLKILDAGAKSKQTRSSRPINFNKKVISILHYELSDWPREKIAERVGLTLNRVNIICNSDDFKRRYNNAMAIVENKILENRAKQALEDPVVKTFREAAPDAAVKKVDLMKTAESEFVQSAAASEILDRAGYGVKQAKYSQTTEISEEIAARWDKQLLDDAPEITITKKITKKSAA